MTLAARATRELNSQPLDKDTFEPLQHGFELTRLAIGRPFDLNNTPGSPVVTPAMSIRRPLGSPLP